MKVFDATITDVNPPNATWAVISYRKEDGGTGTVQVFLEDYDVAYWPPARGDVIRVVFQSVNVVARPRGIP